jgi:hypothetical protein
MIDELSPFLGETPKREGPRETDTDLLFVEFPVAAKLIANEDGTSL